MRTPALVPEKRCATSRDPLLILFEDEHLLVIHKPAGMNTHAPSPYAGEGIYDWLRNREARWTNLAIIHRLDKGTSGLMVFAKTAVANRSLTEQFAQRLVSKRYLLVTDRAVGKQSLIARSNLVKVGSKYLSRPIHAGGDLAETEFKLLRVADGRTYLESRPLTGRTHQIRVHAAEQGFPILGDELYGGTPAHRLWLHAEELSFRHPATSEPLSFRAPADFEADARTALRDAIIDPEKTNAYRLIHGSSDKWPGWYVDRLGPFLLSQSETSLNAGQRIWLAKLIQQIGARGAYHKTVTRKVRQSNLDAASPQLVAGEAASGFFQVKENGVTYELSFDEGYSVGLFLDQRDNRRRFLVNHIAAGFPLFAEASQKTEVLNTFAYTCGFSVCAALAGASVTSLDLSKKYLKWGKRNFVLNGLDPAEHDFIYGDVFDWMKRMGKKRRGFDAIILDPPTFSQSKEFGIFRAEKDYPKLVGLALTLMKSRGVLLASTNAAKWAPEDFVNCLKSTIAKAKRKIIQMHYAPQPTDFPVTRADPAY